MKYQIKKNSVQETLIIPVYGRKMCSILFPNLFRDETALQLMDKIDYDFSELERKSKSVMQQFGFLEVAMRQNDLAWEVRDYLKGHPMAAGVFYYFLKEQVERLVQAMAKAFPGGKMVFDAANEKAVKLMLKTWIKDAKIQDVGAYFAVADAQKELSAWSQNIRVSSRGYMLGYHNLKDPSVKASYRLLAKIGDNIMKMQIVRLDFL